LKALALGMLARLDRVPKGVLSTSSEPLLSDPPFGFTPPRSSLPALPYTPDFPYVRNLQDCSGILTRDATGQCMSNADNGLNGCSDNIMLGQLEVEVENWEAMDLPQISVLLSELKSDQIERPRGNFCPKSVRTNADHLRDNYICCLEQWERYLALPTPAPPTPPPPSSAPSSAPPPPTPPPPTPPPPTPAPSSAPTPAPSSAPTPAPSSAPTPAPTPAPSSAPTPAPSSAPTPAPTPTPPPPTPVPSFYPTPDDNVEPLTNISVTEPDKSGRALFTATVPLLKDGSGQTDQSVVLKINGFPRDCRINEFGQASCTISNLEVGDTTLEAQHCVKIDGKQTCSSTKTETLKITYSPTLAPTSSPTPDSRVGALTNIIVSDPDDFGQVVFKANVPKLKAGQAEQSVSLKINGKPFNCDIFDGQASCTILVGLGETNIESNHCVKINGEKFCDSEDQVKSVLRTVHPTAFPTPPPPTSVSPTPVPPTPVPPTPLPSFFPTPKPDFSVEGLTDITVTEPDTFGNVIFKATVSKLKFGQSEPRVSLTINGELFDCPIVDGQAFCSIPVGLGTTRIESKYCVKIDGEEKCQSSSEDKTVTQNKSPAGFPILEVSLGGVGLLFTCVGVYCAKRCFGSKDTGPNIKVKKGRELFAKLNDLQLYMPDQSKSIFKNASNSSNKFELKSFGALSGAKGGDEKVACEFKQKVEVILGLFDDLNLSSDSTLKDLFPHKKQLNLDDLKPVLNFYFLLSMYNLTVFSKKSECFQFLNPCFVYAFDSIKDVKAQRGNDVPNKKFLDLAALTCYFDTQTQKNKDFVFLSTSVEKEEDLRPEIQSFLKNFWPLAKSEGSLDRTHLRDISLLCEDGKTRLVALEGEINAELDSLDTVSSSNSNSRKLSRTISTKHKGADYKSEAVSRKLSRTISTKHKGAAHKSEPVELPTSILDFGFQPPQSCTDNFMFYSAYYLTAIALNEYNSLSIDLLKGTKTGEGSRHRTFFERLTCARDNFVASNVHTVDIPPGNGNVASTNSSTPLPRGQIESGLGNVFVR
jgi:hypothetical protein